jgi:hypothetical protein
MTMHADHRLWDREAGFWRDDIRAWQHELAAASSDLKSLEAALQKHGEAIRTHAAAIRLAEQDVDGHEHALTEFEKGGSGEDLIPLASKHLDEAAWHARQRAAHEGLKRRHHAIMALWQSLMKALPLQAKE